MFIACILKYIVRYIVLLQNSIYICMPFTCTLVAQDVVCLLPRLMDFCNFKLTTIVLAEKQILLLTMQSKVASRPWTTQFHLDCNNPSHIDSGVDFWAPYKLKAVGNELPITSTMGLSWFRGYWTNLLLWDWGVTNGIRDPCTILSLGVGVFVTNILGKFTLPITRRILGRSNEDINNLSGGTCNNLSYMDSEVDLRAPYILKVVGYH